MAAVRALVYAARDASPTQTERPVCVIDGFLSPALCRMLIEGFERNVDRLDMGAADPYWRARLLYFQALAHGPRCSA